VVKASFSLSMVSGSRSLIRGKENSGIELKDILNILAKKRAVNTALFKLSYLRMKTYM